MIDRDNDRLSVARQAQLLEINRSSLYYKPVAPESADEALKRRILEIYLAHPHYGSRSIASTLRREGQRVNRKRTRRLMRELGIQGICPGPNLSRRNHKEGVFPYLLRDVQAERPDHVWAIDITYIRLGQGFVYLTAVIDLYSRYIIGWDISTTLEIGFVLGVVRRALVDKRPEIWNSDQGSHFTSPQYVDLLREAGVSISMDGKNRALDNVFIERFWRSVKWECVYLQEFHSPREARIGIAEYIRFYNEERPHQSLNDQTPAEVYHADCEALESGFVHISTAINISPPAPPLTTTTKGELIA